MGFFPFVRLRVRMTGLVIMKNGIFKDNSKTLECLRDYTVCFSTFCLNHDSPELRMLRISGLGSTLKSENPDEPDSGNHFAILLSELEQPASGSCLALSKRGQHLGGSGYLNLVRCLLLRYGQWVSFVC